jgi:hypothetical protein
MEIVVQGLVVGIIVAFCAIFSAWRLMSPKVRLRALEAITPVMSKLGAGAALTRLRTQTIGQLVAGGCSACSHSKSAVHHPGARRS